MPGSGCSSAFGPVLCAQYTLSRGVLKLTAQLPPVDDDYRRFLREELDAWRTENPAAVRWLRRFDHVAALARPVISIALVVTGWGLAGPVVGQPGHLLVLVSVDVFQHRLDSHDVGLLPRGLQPGEIGPSDSPLGIEQ